MGESSCGFDSRPRHTRNGRTSTGREDGIESLRVAAIQYFIRPVSSIEGFAGQVTSLVDAAADYGSRLVVFPEYFTTQLLTLGDLDRPIDRQIRQLCDHLPFYLELLSGLARRHGIYLVGGTIPVRGEGDEVYNEAFVFGPSGDHVVQGKLHMTRFEREEWIVSPRSTLRVVETDFGRLAVAICYDVEFPEIARAAVRADAHILVVPSCTDDRRGFLRVRYCAHARAVENNMYVVHAATVGSLPSVPAVHLNYGQAALLTPCDFAFPRDGILAEGQPNIETMVIGDLDMVAIERNRTFGTVLPLEDSKRTREMVRDPEIVIL